MAYLSKHFHLHDIQNFAFAAQIQYDLEENGTEMHLPS